MPSTASWRDLDLPSSLRSRLERAAAEPSSVVELGSIDNDGRLLSDLGPWPGMRPVGPSEFVPRYRFDLDLVLFEGSLAIRKRFRGDRRSLRREIAALERLDGASGVPRLLGRDPGATELIKEFVPGATLRDLLVERGARILTAQVEADGDLAHLPRERRIEAVWARGREHFLQLAAAESDWQADLADAVGSIHRRGVSGFSLTFGNVVLDRNTGRPRLIDFDKARVAAWRFGPRHLLGCRRDRTLLRRIYGVRRQTPRPT